MMASIAASRKRDDGSLGYHDTSSMLGLSMPGGSDERRRLRS